MRITAIHCKKYKTKKDNLNVDKIDFIRYKENPSIHIASAGDLSEKQERKWGIEKYFTIYLTENNFLECKIHRWTAYTGKNNSLWDLLI